MAKRYFSFESLKEGYFKPCGTMGNHHATIVPQGGDRMVVVGSAKGRVTLSPGDTLGYNCGEVWIVPSPDSYRDPIRRVLALAKIPQRALEYSNEPVEYSISYGKSLPGSCADTETGERVRAILGEHQDREIPDSHWHFPDNGEYHGGFGSMYEIRGGDAIVITAVASFEPTTLSRRRRVSRVVVRQGADKGRVAAWLENEFDVGQARERTIFEDIEKR